MATSTGTKGTQTRIRTTTTTKVPTIHPTEEQIRIRAHEIYLARGCTPGNPDTDWRQAEQELRGRLTLLGKTT